MGNWQELIERFNLVFPLGERGSELALVLMVGLSIHLLLRIVGRQLHRFTAVSKQRWDDIAITAAELPLKVVLWASVGYFLVRTYRSDAGASDYPFHLLVTTIIVVLAWFVHRVIRGIEAELLVERRGLTDSKDKAAVLATGKLLRIMLWIIASLMILQRLGLSVSGLLAFGGVGGIAVGFAAKGLLANFFGGLSIYLDRPFTVGDWVRSPDREIEGTVEDIGWRLTRIRTFDQRPLYVPNSIFSEISVENPSRMWNRRIYETIGLRYSDSEQIPNILADVKALLEQHSEVDQSRTLIVNLVSFGPSSLDFFIYCFTKTIVWVDYHAIKQEILLEVLAIIRRHDAELAIPATRLSVEQLQQPMGVQQAMSGQQTMETR